MEETQPNITGVGHNNNQQTCEQERRKPGELKRDVLGIFYDDPQKSHTLDDLCEALKEVDDRRMPRKSLVSSVNALIGDRYVAAKNDDSQSGDAQFALLEPKLPDHDGNTVCHNRTEQKILSILAKQGDEGIDALGIRKSTKNGFDRLSGAQFAFFLEALTMKNLVSVDDTDPNNSLYEITPEDTGFGGELFIDHDSDNTL